jgi:hypothetical protein
MMYEKSPMCNGRNRAWQPSLRPRLAARRVKAACCARLMRLIPEGKLRPVSAGQVNMRSGPKSLLGHSNYLDHPVANTSRFYPPASGAPPPCQVGRVRFANDKMVQPGSPPQRQWRLGCADGGEYPQIANEPGRFDSALSRGPNRRSRALMLLRGEPKSPMASSARDVVAGLIAQRQSWLEAGAVRV